MKSAISKSEHVKHWRKRTKQRIINSFGGKCGICNYSKCQNALELHHLIPENKEFSFGAMKANPKSWGVIVEELRKCVLVCANCHREIHADLVKIPENITRFNEDFVDYKQIEKIDNDSSLLNNCPICNKNKPYWHKTCSKSCATQLKGKYDWNKYNLRDLYENQKMNFTDIATIVGCNGASVKKRLIAEGVIVKSIKKKINWPSNEELRILVPRKSLVKIAKDIGCSETGLRKHLRKNKINWNFEDSWKKRLCEEKSLDNTIVKG